VIFLAAPLLRRIPARARLALGLASVALGRAIAITPRLPRPFDALQELLGGADGAGWTTITSGYPFLGCFGTILLGMQLGDLYGRSTQRGQHDECVREVRRMALAGAALTLVLVGSWAFLKRGHVHSPALVFAQRFLYPDSDGSLVPLYSGVALVLFSAFLRFERGSAFERFLVVFGKTSLVTYVLQYFAVETLPAALGWRHHLSLAAVLVLLGVAIPTLYAIARIYNDRFAHR
jgi:hypothetical protein